MVYLLTELFDTCEENVQRCLVDDVSQASLCPQIHPLGKFIFTFCVNGWFPM